MQIARKYIRDLRPGDRVVNVYRIGDFQLREAKNGSKYASFSIFDKTGSLPVKAWDIGTRSVVQDENQYAKGGLAVVEFEVSTYQDSLQGSAFLVRAVSQGGRFDLTEIIPAAPEQNESMYAELADTASRLQDPQLKKVVQYVLKDRKDQLLNMPGAKSMHHDVLSGLLYHTVRMTRSAQALAAVYPEVNRDLLTAGTILHDIGKLDEYKLDSVGLVASYTPAGSLLSHNILGVVYIQQVCSTLNVDAEVCLLLSHMIESHHGRPEYGSAVVPMFLEAELLHLLDMADAQIWEYKVEYQKIEPGTVSAKSCFALGHPVYNPALGRMAGSEKAEIPH